MNETNARAIAAALNGTASQSGGNIWIVVIHRADSRVVVISDDLVCEYADNADFLSGNAATTIALA